MIENCPILALNVKILLFWAIIRHHNYRRYIIMVPFTLLNVSQWLFVFHSLDTSLNRLILSFHFSIIYFCGLCRFFLVLARRVRFENILERIDTRYSELLNTKNPELLDILEYYTRLSQRFSYVNYTLALLMSFAYVANPIIQFERILPYNMYGPGNLNTTVTPYYEALYVYQILVTIVGSFSYIPYSNIFITCLSFGLIEVKILQHNLERGSFNKPDETEPDLKQCVKMHINIYNFVNQINEFYSFMSLVEFMLFGIILCALLFLLAVVDNILQMLLIISYVCVVFVQLFTFYYTGDKLAQEGHKVGFAAYSSKWYTFDKSSKRIIFMIILRSQRPLQVMIGNIYPMTLEKFQTLLNASYSYFTILKKLNK